MSVRWQTLRDIAQGQLEGRPFQYRDKDAVTSGGWHTASVQTFPGLYTLSNHELRVKPKSIPEAEEAEKAGHFLHAAMHFRANGFEDDALRCNQKAREAGRS